MNHNPIIIALDVDSAAEARHLVSQIGDSVEFYKVGMELYAAAGMGIVNSLMDNGKQVFLDLKFHDIGETVKRAVRVVAGSGVRFLTIHAVENVIRAAVEGKGSSGLALLAVTVLTDTDQRDLHRMGLNCTVEELVVRRAQTAVELGVDGLVCSPLEVAQVRRITGHPENPGYSGRSIGGSGIRRSEARRHARSGNCGWGGLSRDRTPGHALGGPEGRSHAYPWIHYARDASHSAQGQIARRWS